MDLWARRSDNAVREHLASLAETDGVTIFLTTHNMAEAEPLCQQVAVVRRGELLEVGHPDEPRARTGAPRVNVVGRGFTARVIERLRRSSDVTNVVANNDHLTIDLRDEGRTAGRVSLLVSSGAEIEEVRRGLASLEEVFVRLVREEQ